MFCRGQAIGLAVFMFGTGLLLGSLLPSCLPVWLFALAVIAAGLFLRRFVEDRPWLHLDIAGTADNSSVLWQHHVPGATGAAVSTLYFLAVEEEV